MLQFAASLLKTPEMEDSTTRADKRTCPFCGVGNDAQTGVGTNSPQPDEGCVSICAYCGEIGFFGPGGKSIHKPTETEMSELMASEDEWQRIKIISEEVKLRPFGRRAKPETRKANNYRIN